MRFFLSQKGRNARITLHVRGFVESSLHTVVTFHQCYACNFSTASPYSEKWHYNEAVIAGNHHVVYHHYDAYHMSN